MPKSNLTRRGVAKKSKEIYLDYAASVFSNPSSIHSLGVNAKKKLDEARRGVADVLGARSSEIFFTSGATESNNLAIQGAVLFWRETRASNTVPHIITTNIEHPSVLETCRLLEKRKLAQLSIVAVESNGIIDPKKIKNAIKKNTLLVSVMYANNEIGTIQPIKEIAKVIKHYKKQEEKKKDFLRSSVLRVPLPARPFQNLSFFPLLHTDAVQAANYLDLNVEKLGVDMLTLSGSKIEGTGRVGVLYKRASVSLANVFGGGDQEGGLRPGTPNLPEILKFANALKSAQKNKEQEAKQLIKLRDYFIKQLSRMPLGNELIINGDTSSRLPNNINITIPKIPSDLLVIELSARGIMASSKNACKSSSAEGSYVIKALRDKVGLAAGAFAEEGGVRFSMGRLTTKKDIDYTVKALSEILAKLKKWYN